MKQYKFNVTFFSPSPKASDLRKQLVDKGLFPHEVERATKSKKQKLADYLDTVIAVNDGYTNEQIAAAVLKQAKVNNGVLLDNVVLNTKTDETLTVVEALEFQLTVKTVCELAGI